MKKVFTKQEFYNSAGCWRKNRPDELKCLINNLSKNNLIHFEDILLSDVISLADKRWWIKNSCNLTIKEFQYYALESAKFAAKYYNKKYPKDNRISLCVNITARYLKGLVSFDVLIKYRKNAADAYAYAADAAAADAAYAAAAYAAAADAYAYAAAADAYANAYAYAAAADAYAADAAAADAAYAAAAYAAAADAYAAYAAYANEPMTRTELIMKWIKLFNTFD